MPIKITCKACNVVLKVPDTAAGKKIKCPKCSAATAVPAAEEAALAVSGTGSSRRDDDGPDRSDEDARKRRRRKSKSRDQSNNRLLIGLGIGGFAILLIAVGVFIIFKMSGSDALTADAGQKPQPAKQVKPSKQVEQPKAAEADFPPPTTTATNPARGHEKTAALNKLRQVNIAIENHSIEKKFVPTVGGRRDGLSWRVLILPEIGQMPLYRAFKLDEPWNSDHNLKVFNDYAMPSIYDAERTNTGEERKTYLQLFIGPGTCFPTPDTKLRKDGLARGTGNTWLMAEAKTPIEWTRPDELEVKGGQMPALGGVYVGDFFVMSADGKAHYVYNNQFSAADMLLLVSPSNTTPVKGWPPE